VPRNYSKKSYSKTRKSSPRKYGRTKNSGGGRGAKRGGTRNAQTVRIVIEQPASAASPFNAAGKMVAPASVRKASF